MRGGISWRKLEGLGEGALLVGEDGCVGRKVNALKELSRLIQIAFFMIKKIVLSKGCYYSLYIIHMHLMHLKPERNLN